VKIRAVIFDVYGTLMQVGPPPADAEARWRKLYQETFQISPPMSLLDFSIACNRAIRLRHSAAQARGIQFPEILWPSILLEVLAGFAKLSEAAKADFIAGQIQLGRTTKLMPGAAETIRWLSEKRQLLGIASNAQAYSLRELEGCLMDGGLDLRIFDPDLCYWSFQHGFSKPENHIFQIFRIRLEARGITSPETLMVGDRVDNDIDPAQKHGFQTWLLSSTDTEKNAGNWKQLSEFLAYSV